MVPDPLDWPDWWEWELEFTPHLLKRMVDRGFNEVDLRAMLASASGYRPSASEGRFVIMARYDGRDWDIVVEPDETSRQLLVITAYARGSS
ncbi:DUF4258 domain-containing protein [Tautonia marina]|uniref:DUF4258 domain-containing protein n=1 Tax=Tautonia marina TaxID=2653855 RepID=UPI001375F62E|nr:DUF4258 domain-containing protein [Tautonia marina]